MKSASLSLTFTLPACLTLLAGTGQAELSYHIRPDYQNLSTANTATQAKNPFVTPLQGHIKPPLTAPSSGPQGGPVENLTRLTECSFGQPLAQWIPSSTWADEQVAVKRSILYPPASGMTRTQLEQSLIVFRYKTLLYAPTAPGQPILNNFDNIYSWFGDMERFFANLAIEQLRDDIAKAPFHTGLRNLLLDVIHDLAVAEMQGINKQLAELAKKRLGFTVTSPFIIDEEIEAYEALAAQMEGVLTKYQELLGDPIDGVEPSTFDPDPRVKNMPMGRYLFIRSQPTRNSVASKYLDANNVEKTVPTLGAYPPGPAAPPVVDRTTDILFSGYKDYTMLYTIMGRYVQYQADLARLLGMRQAPGDLTRARGIALLMQGKMASDFWEMENLCFPATFAKNDASGVHAARSGVETALADIANVRGFLTGEANLLGLDPNFLLLVQDPNPPTPGPRESFDVLRDKLKGANQPLTVALDRMATARTDYEAYKGSVDKVVSEMADIGDTHATRYREITGYDVDESPGFQGVGKPNSGSELDIVALTLTSLRNRATTLSDLSRSLADDEKAALGSVDEAIKKRELLTSASETYKTKTRNTYEQLGILSGVSAGAQALADTVMTAASLESPLSVGNTLVIGGAGAVNAGVQTYAAKKSVDYEQELDYAALEFDVALDATDAELTVNQARQEVGAIKRETYSHKLETEDTTNAIIQTMAQKTALLTELTNLEKDLEGNTEALRSTYYADPIHYLRAENSLIQADEAFRHAQRLLFYTQRAAEYKWQEKFAITESAQRSWDSTSLFKLRNAAELDNLLTQLVRWNDARAAQVGSEEITSIISLRDHLIAPNPNLLNADPSQRADPATRMWNGEAVTKLEFFRRTLQAEVGGGVLSLPFDTTALKNINSAFFTGATYSGNSLVSPGIWRDKIVWIRGNIVSTGAAFGTRSCSLDYGGNTQQRTRFPAGSAPIDPKYVQGEITSEPFVYWQSPEFNDLFVPKYLRNATTTFGFSPGSALSWTVGGNEYLNVPELQAFNQLSVAANGWKFRINVNTIDLSKIEDIELLIRHRYSQRIAP